MLGYQRPVSCVSTMVDVSKQVQALAGEPDHKVVKLINHIVMIVVSVEAKLWVDSAPMPGFVGFLRAQLFVFVEVGISNQ